MNKILGVIATLMTAVSVRRDAAKHQLERGASTLELVIIAAGLLFAAITVVGIIVAVINSRSAGIY